MPKRGTHRPGFFIIASLRKIRSVAELTAAEQQEFMRILFSLRKGMGSVLGITRTCIYQNETSTWPFHVWVFPFHPWMKKSGMRMSSIEKIKDHAVAIMDTQKTRAKVKAYVSRMKEYLDKNF